MENVNNGNKREPLDVDVQPHENPDLVSVHLKKNVLSKLLKVLLEQNSLLTFRMK